MWLKKIVVKITVAYCEEVDESFLGQIEREFTFYYTPFTKTKKLLETIYEKSWSNDPFQEVIKHYYVYKNGEQLLPDVNSRLSKLIGYLNCEDILNIEYVIWNGIGASIDEDDGIRYFYHTKELRHVPHIHAKYQDEEISIDILTLKVKGQFKNSKKQKKAVRYVKKNEKMLLDMYNKKTNGIHVYDLYS